MIQLVHISDPHLITVKKAKIVAKTINGFAGIFPWVASKFSRADPTILKALKSAIPAESGGQAHVALTGDICAWPGETSSEIDAHYQHFQSIMMGLTADSTFLPILGNHDWGDQTCKLRTTEFANSLFETKDAITQVNADIVTDGSLNVIIFRIDSNIACVPAYGFIEPGTLTALKTLFNSGPTEHFKDRSNRSVSSIEYTNAVKVLLLHHSPLQFGHYTNMPLAEYHSLRLLNIDQLLEECRNDIDLILFGHTHVPLMHAFDGFVMINGGASLSNQANIGNANFHMIQIKDRNSISVETFYWDGRTSFNHKGPKSGFVRGAMNGTVRGYGKWA